MSGVHSTAGDIDVDLGKLFASLARSWRRILVVALGVAALAFAVRLAGDAALPRRNASADRNARIRLHAPRPAERRIGQSSTRKGVTSQVEVITSTDILKQVPRSSTCRSCRNSIPRPTCPCCRGCSFSPG